MKNQSRYIASILLSGWMILGNTSCNSSNVKKDTKSDEEPVLTSLINIPLSDIQKQVNGKWELLIAENETEAGEFENTFITINNDDYIWTEEGISEPGEMNWRLEPTEFGYEAWLMDVFYADSPSFPLAIKGDTLYLQDCTDTKFKFTLVKRK